MSTTNVTVDYVSFRSTLDNETLPVPEVVANRSHMIMDMIQGCNVEGSTPEPITLDVEYSVATLKLACDLAILAHKTPVPDSGKKTTVPKNDVVDPAIRAKVNAVAPAAKELLEACDYPALEDLMKACSFLQDMECVHIVAKIIALRLEGKTTEELRIILGVVNDFTPEEEEDIKKNCRVVNFEKKEDKSE